MNIFKMANKSVRWAFNFTKWSPSESDLLLATACIQPEEKERLARFVFKKDFKSSIIGRLMMRKFVHEGAGIPYNEIQFGRDDKGKPILISQNSSKSTKLAFNVSHHGNFVVLAGEIGSTLLGVDVMKLEYSGTRTLSEYFRIMKKPFSENEWAEIKAGITEKDQIDMFCRHWCLKESYVKAIGVGITVNLQDISFKINTGLTKECLTTDSELYLKGVKENWLFEEILIDDEHCVAVALCKNEQCNRETIGGFSELQFSDIMDHAVPLLQYDDVYCRNYLKKPEAP